MGNSKPSPFLTSLFVILTILVLGVLIAAIGIGAYFLRDCPVQPHIPVYLIVFGVFVLLVLIVSLGLFYGLRAKDTFELLLSSLLVISVSFILYLFIVCWFIAGSVWIYSVHHPSYDPTHEPNYCNKTLYLFVLGFQCFISVYKILVKDHSHWLQTLSNKRKTSLESMVTFYKVQLTLVMY